MYPLESSTEFIVDLSPLELGDTHSRAQSGLTRCQPRCQMTGWRSLADAADMVSAVLDVVGQNVAVAIHPSAHGFQTAAGDYQRAPAGLLGRGRTVAGGAVGSASWAQGRGHCGGDGQADASAGGNGRKVVAVDPVAGMRERLAAALTGVELLDGVAEATPLDDPSVHAATVGQAFHWFDVDRALTEIHRVGRVGGRVGSRP